MLNSPRLNVFRCSRHHPVALLWTGQTTSRLGDGLYRIVFSKRVLEKTDSAVAMGTLLIFSQIPRLLFLLMGSAVTVSQITSTTIRQFLLFLAQRGNNDNGIHAHYRTV